MNQSTTAKVSSQRNYGLDMLRLLASFYVITVHTTGIGGVIGATASGSYQNYVCRLITIFCYCAVNIFGLISGYVGYREGEKKAPFSGIFTLWLSAVFYTLLYVGIFHILIPGSVTSNDLTMAFFPVTFQSYWFLSVHIVVYFLSPFINKILYHSSEKDLKKLFVVCYILVFIEYIGRPFGFASGYSVAWLLLLYVMGGIMKKTGICSNIPAYAAALGILLINVSLLILGIKREFWSISIFTFDLAADSTQIAPFYLATAILHVVLFSKLKFNAFCKKLINFSVPAVFSIYIINTNKILWNNFILGDFMQGFLTSWASSSPVGVFAKITLFSFVLMVAAIVIDFFRQKLFRLLGVQHWPQKLSDLFHKTKVS